MALVFAARCVRTGRHWETGDWARRAVVVGDGRRDDGNPGDEAAAAGAETETKWRRPPPAGQLELRLSPGRGEEGEVGLFWPDLTAPQLCRAPVSPGGPPVTGSRGPSPPVTGSRGPSPPGRESIPGPTALADLRPHQAHVEGGGPARRSSPPRREDNCRPRLWNSRPCRWLRPAPLRRGWPTWPPVRQARSYGHFRDGGFRGKNGALSLQPSNTVYYDILKISPSATQSQIKSAYYKQSLLYHPDKNAGSEEAALRFTQINEAYSVLGSVNLRKKYDRGILTPADLQSGKRPAEKAHAARTQPPQAWSSTENPETGKSRFNFDEFYKAHYGEQLAREQTLRERRMQERRNRETLGEKWHFHKLIEVAVTVMLIAGFCMLFSIKSK
ncbi:uncharacterized protein LOC119974716 [Scyliorhinus canicula]|uniref:uncharacterized protein LOC119974716 n=1 Tax=Scyliorhinus canicula TaxID=7830 RepID=UPI0018F4D747|nr:uncharacterized protein LOC119974716 [Scyliorhinus canicula]